MPSDRLTGRLTGRDLRAALRLVNECRDLGGDASAWHAHLVRHLGALTHAQVGIGANLVDFTKGRNPRNLSLFRTGWPSPDAERRWAEYSATVAVQRTPEYIRLIGFPGPIITRTRQQLYPDAEWYRSNAYNLVHRACGIDHYLFSMARVKQPGSRGELFNSVWLHRPIGERPFSRRDWWLVRLVHAEAGAMIGRALATPGSPGPSELPARQREALGRLLAGDSEKQIARAMGVSPATAHEYVGAVYRHFGVSSRGELMARFVGRGTAAG